MLFILIWAIWQFVNPAPILIAHAAEPAVVINELMWMGSSASSADEWIELRNTTDQAMDISDWKLTKKSSGAEAPMLTLPAGQSIPPGGFYVISNYSDASTSSALAVAPNYVTSDVALSNSALQIKLYDTTNNLIDVADDGAGNPLAGQYDSAGKNYASMERNPVPGDGTLPSAWHSASRGTGFKEGKTERGTPGAANSNGLPVANAGPDQTAVVGQEVNFDGSDSNDPDGQTLTWQWDFGDGGTGAEATPKHIYAVAGSYTVTLTVSDSTDTATDQTTIIVTAVPTTQISNVNTNVNTNTTANPAPVTPTSCRGIKINELYPNPTGADDSEFIELINETDAAISPTGCKIWIGAERFAPLPDDNIAPRAYFSWPKESNHLSLINGGATVTLVDADGQELDRVVYGAAPEGKSWSRFDTSWAWTDKVTSGTVNQEPSESEVTVAAIADQKTTNTNSAVTNTSTKKTTKKTPPKPKTITLDKLQSLSSGDLVIVSGVVTAGPEILGAHIFYLQDKTGATYVDVDGSTKITAGKMVSVNGVVRVSQSRRHVKAKAADIKIVGTTYAIASETIMIDNLSMEQLDRLVRVDGVVSEVRGSRVVIDDGTGETVVYIKPSTGITRPLMSSGDKLSAIGIVNSSTSGLRILPRVKEDLVVTRAVIIANTNTPAPVAILPAASPRQRWWYWGLAGLGAVATGVKPAWKAWRKSRVK